MKTETTIVKGVRSKQSVWNALQKIADKTEMGNLNHLVNKIFNSYIKNQKKG